MLDLTRQTQLRESIELMYFGYRAFTARQDRMLDHRGLGRVHHRVLYFVARNPDTSVNALLKILGVSKQALNAPLRQLIEMKLVTQRAAPHDRRSKQLRLSYEGEKLEAQLTAAQMQQLNTVFTRVGRKAEQAWRQVMQQLAGSMHGQTS